MNPEYLIRPSLEAGKFCRERLRWDQCAIYFAREAKLWAKIKRSCSMNYCFVFNLEYRAFVQ